jgi:hypothetical protein
MDCSLLHSMWHRCFAKSVLSFTTDLGIELGLHKLGASVDLDKFVPGFGALHLETEGDELALAESLAVDSVASHATSEVRE